MKALEIIGLGALGVLGWRAYRSISHQLGAVNKEQKMASEVLTAIQNRISEIKALNTKISNDVTTLIGRLENGNPDGLTRDEATAIANELGGIVDQLRATDDRVPEGEEPPAEEPPAEEPPVDEPPAEGTPN